MTMRRLQKAHLALAISLLVLAQPAQAAVAQLDQKLAALSNAGSAEAAYHLGMLYHMGLAGVRKDPRKAFELFKLAADRGDPLGAYKVGCFYDGQGEGVVESNLELALKYKRIAAEAGYNLAQEDIAKHLFDRGDMEAGLRWLETAALQGSRMPLLAVGSLYAGLLPPDAPALKIEKDVVKGWAYMLLAARDIPEMQKSFEVELSQKLSAQEQKRVKEFVSNWKPKPTPLSTKGGIDEAYKLAGLPVPKS